MTDTAFYADMLATANELLDEFGQPGTLITPGTRTGDKWNPTIGDPGAIACTLVETDYNLREIDGTNILATDKRIIIKADPAISEIIPSATQVTYAGKTSPIIGPVKPLNPAGIAALIWTAQVRL